jgi:hypothetical protein
LLNRHALNFKQGRIPKLYKQAKNEIVVAHGAFVRVNGHTAICGIFDINLGLNTEKRRFSNRVNKPHDRGTEHGIIKKKI